MLSDSPSLDEDESAFRRAWRRLTEPSPGISDPEERRRARLLLSLLVAMMAVGIPASILGPWVGLGLREAMLDLSMYVGLGTCALLGVSYALARTRHHENAAVAMVWVTAAGGWVAYLVTRQSPTDTFTLTFLSVSVVLSSILLPLGFTIGLGVFQLAGILLIPVLLPDVPFPAVVSPLIGTAFIASLLAVSNAIRRADTRERRIAQDALKANEERYRALVERSPDGIVVLSEGRFVYANPSALRIMGARDMDDLKGRMATSLLEPAVRPVVEARIQSIRGGGSTPPLEVRLHRLDGRTVHVELMGAPATHDGKPADQTILRDITSRKQAEEAARVAREQKAEIEQLQEISTVKTHLLNTASHELSTPISALRLQLHLLKMTETGDDPRRKRALDLLDRNVERLGVLVRDVLDVARMQSGQLRLRVAPADLAEIAREATELYEEPARAAGVELVLDSPRPVPLQADAQRVSQVVINLLSNAIKFTGKGGRVTVRVRAEKDEAVIAVEDTGAGLAGEQIGRLFQPFSQVHDAMNEPRGGTGLGLHISRGIAEQHGGRIWVESAGPGHGSTFFLALPVKARAAAAPTAA